LKYCFGGCFWWSLVSFPENFSREVSDFSMQLKEHTGNDLSHPIFTWGCRNLLSSSTFAPDLGNKDLVFVT
jgi:hypothetical protein